MDVRHWLSALGLERYADAFVDNDIDAAVLGELSEADLVELGVSSLGHRKKLSAAIRDHAGVRQAQLAGTQTVSLAPGGLAEPIAPAPSPGTVADRSGLMSAQLEALLQARGYVVTGHLGEGGMGNVLRARQHGVARTVAVKVLHRRSGGDNSIRFVREARAIAALTHPNSVRLFDFLEGDDGEACIVMEYVEGPSLAAKLAQERRLPFSRAAEIVMMVCDALTEAHGKGIVHRDIKPANIILQEAHGYVEFPRVLDFGLARWVLADESRLTRTGAVYGTPRYLAPEQIDSADVTLKCDLYSLGVVFYEALAGRPPFPATTEATLFYQHLKEPAPPLPADVPRPEGTDALLERLLAKSPGLRPASAHALRRELAALTRSRVSSSPPSTARRTVIVDAAPERRHVAVLAVELFDLTAGEGSAESQHALLGRCRAAADSVRRRHGGFQVSADGARQTWVFGAPIAHRDDTRRALLASLDLCDVLRSIEGARPKIGVTAGQAVAGSTEWGRQPLVVGDPLGHAAALRAQADPGEVLVTQDLLDEGDTSDPTAHDGVRRLRAAMLRSASASGLTLPFVGRAREVAELEAVFDRCRRTGTGRIVVVAGEAGIGKSRLLDRIRPSADHLGYRSARAQLGETGLAPENDIMRQLVHALLELPDAPEARADALDDRIASFELAAGHWPFLFHYLEVPLSRSMQRIFDALEPKARQAGYRDMLAALLAGLSRTAPLALAIEDLHWADTATLATIETLCAFTAALPIVLLFTSRVEGEERWRHCLVGQTVTRLELGPLGVTEADALARRLGASDDRRKRAVARAGGHPLLLTEMVRSARDDDSLPPHIQGLVHARLDQLPELDRAAVQVAAVLGQRIVLDDLREVLGVPEYDPAKLLDYRLLERPDARYAFTHALVRDAVYDSIVDDRRRALHERCAPLADDPAQSAMHLERAGSPDAAMAYLDAAQRAYRADRYQDARGLAERGAALATDVAGAVLLEQKGKAELSLGDVEAAEASYAAMAELATDDAERYRAAVGRADALRAWARPDDALAMLDDAERFAERARLEAGRAFYLRGGVYFATGRLTQCRQAHERALAAARRDCDDELIARASSGLADALYGAGRIASARDAYDECVTRAEDAGLLGIEVLNRPMLAIVSVFMNDLERARALAEDTIDRARALSHRRAETLGLGAACLAALHQRRYADAAAHGASALALTQAGGSVVFEQTAHYYIARARLEEGDTKRAHDHLDRGLALCRSHSLSFVGAALLATKARLVDDPTHRAALIAEGARVVAEPSLSFNRFWFRENAIEEALERGDPNAAREHAEALRVLTADEPFPWAQQVIADALSRAATQG